MTDAWEMHQAETGLNPGPVWRDRGIIINTLTERNHALEERVAELEGSCQKLRDDYQGALAELVESRAAVERALADRVAMERLAHERLVRSEAAEAREAALRARIEALADEWAEAFPNAYVHALRAALAASPAADATPEPTPACAGVKVEGQQSGAGMLCDPDGIVRGGMWHHGTDYECTGSAHYGPDAVILCANPVHEIDYPTPAAPVDITPGGMPICPECGRWGSGGGLCLNEFHADTTPTEPQAQGGAPTLTGAHPFPICVCLRCGPPFRGHVTNWRDSLGLLGQASWMSLCPTCGSKRCPGAVDHARHPAPVAEPDSDTP